MKGTFGAFLRCSLVIALLSVPLLVVSATTGSASSETTATPTPLCDVVANVNVHIVSSTSPCIISTHVGSNIQLKFRTGWRWGDPMSTSRDLVEAATMTNAIGTTGAVFDARAVGEATISVAGTIYCKPDVACPDLAMLWSIHVIVTKTASQPWTLVVTSDDSGRQFETRPGDRLIVNLDPQSMYTWTMPKSSKPLVVRQLSGASGHSAAGVFVAKSAGHAMVLAVDRPNCKSNCLPPSHLFQINVVVTSEANLVLH